MRQLLLHVGPHKTGTTAVQKALAEARPALAAAGWAYPEVGFVYLGHHGLAEAMLPQQLGRLPALVEALCAVPGHIVLSSENFSRVRLAGWGRFAELLAGRFEVRVVHVLRHPLDVLYAAWQEAVKHGGQAPLPDFLLGELADPLASAVLNPDLALAPLVQVFGAERLTIAGYAQGVAHPGGLVAHLCAEIMGLPVAPPREAYADVNKSFDPVAAELIRLATRAGLPGVALMREGGELRAIAAALRARGAGALARLVLGFDTPVLRQVERRILDRWGARFAFPVPEAGLFQPRARVFEHLDPGVWTDAPDLALRVQAFLTERRARPAG